MSPQVPQIIILVDEFADLPRAVKERLETISNTGRGAGVRVMTCVLRATMAEIPRPMVVQAATRIAMRVNDEGELQYLFDWGWSTRFDISAATAPGMGWVTCNRQAAQQFQAWRLVPSRIDAVSVELAERRPQLDQVSVALAGPYYPTRWQRVLPIMFPLGSVAPAPRSPVDPTPAVAPMNASKESGMDLEQSADRLRAAMAAVQQAADEADAAGGGRSDDPRLDFEEIEEYLAKQADPMSTPAPTGPRPDPRKRMRQLVQAHQQEGIGPRAVWEQLRAEGYPTAEQTVITWMRMDATAGILAQPGGRGKPYVPGPNFTLNP